MKNFNDKYRDILSEIKIFEDALAEVEATDSGVGSALRDELISLKLAKKKFETNVK
jgi:hypothetical protein